MADKQNLDDKKGEGVEKVDLKEHLNEMKAENLRLSKDAKNEGPTEDVKKDDPKGGPAKDDKMEGPQAQSKETKKDDIKEGQTKDVKTEDSQKQAKEKKNEEPKAPPSMVEATRENSSSPALTQDDSAESEKYILNPDEPIKMQTVRKCLDEILGGRELVRVVDYGEEQKMLAALPEVKSEHEGIIIPVLSNGHYLLFQFEKAHSKLIVYSSQKEKAAGLDELEKVKELLKKKGYPDLKVEHPLVDQASTPMDSGIFIVIYAHANIIRKISNYKVGNSKMIREKLCEFLQTKNSKCLDEMVIEGYASKPIVKMESTGFSVPIPKGTNITGTMILPTTPTKLPPQAVTTPARPPPPASTAAPARPPVARAVAPTSPTILARPAASTAAPARAVVPSVATPSPASINIAALFQTPPSPTLSASSEGSYSYSLPGSPTTPNGLLKYRKYLKKYRKMAREDDEGVQYAWTKYNFDDDSQRRERRSFADNSRYPPRRGNRRMVLMEIDSEVTWNLMIRCKFCMDTFTNASDCKEHIIDHHNLQRN